MKIYRLFLSIGLIMTLSAFTYAQEELPDGIFQLTPLTPEEEVLLRSLPVLKPPPDFATRELPAVVDNSEFIFMRPAYQQAGLSCGQATLIGYNFTYEMARARNLNASQIQNQYPSHFAWNFMHGGDGYFGVSYLHSIQILKEYGMPDVVDYGGTMSYGGSSRWMSGYDQYYNGMHNRITNAYQLQVGTPEGLLVLKNWLHNHLEGSPVGGLASFYAQHMSVYTMLQWGTPEAGKYVLTYFGGSPNHAMTIVGYNDSIRWDYNGDGQYTNHLDINGDGVVDMKDWEIGGFKMVQSYGGVPNWGDGGYAYMMYKTVADNLGSGGIWNHCVHILDVKETCDPKLTARITLKHTRRNRIKVLAGIANSITASKPEITLGFPIYDYQGGDKYMQGGTTEADKTIEFGLDISKLLSYVNLSQFTKVFLQVVENDPGNAFPGEIIHYSIYDHTGTGLQIVCPQTNVPLVNNDTTTLSVMHVFNFDRVHILDELLPPAPAGQYYSHQLSASGGTPPYIWELDKKYQESSQTATFPLINAVQLYPSNNTSGKVTQAIGFDFPFYDSTFNSITVYVDGYLMFDQQLYPYPYFYDDKVLFNITRNISPFMNQKQELVSGQGCGIWYEGDANSATFRWKTVLTDNPSLQFNYAVKLFPDGTIKFYYGTMTGCAQHLWISGISEGDNFNHQITAISNKPAVTENSSITLQRYNYPPELQITPEGLYHGTPQQSYGGEQIMVKVTDNNFIHTIKTIPLSSIAVIVQDSIVSGGNNIIAAGEEAVMSVTLTNLMPYSIPDVFMKIRINDPYFTVTDSTENIGTLPPNISSNFYDAFHFEISPDVPNNYFFTIETIITADTNIWEGNLFHTAFAPVIEVETITVDDDNGRLDPGDSTNITVRFINAGGVDASNLVITLDSSDPFVNIHLASGMIQLLEPEQASNVTFNISVSEACPPGHDIVFVVNIAGDNNFTSSHQFSLIVGLYQEGFETGEFNLFAWGCGGDRPWTIDTYYPLQGNFCAKSGPITHDEESVLKIDMDVAMDGEIGFSYRISCENDPSANNNFDYLVFLMDGNEMGRWDGFSDWTRRSYPVTAGFHRFEWAYRKNSSLNYSMDAAWLDNISFPQAFNVSPILSVEPDQIDGIFRPDEVFTATLQLFNVAQGDLDFMVLIAGHMPAENPRNYSGRSIRGSYLVSDADYFHSGQEYVWNLRTYNAGNDNERIKQIFISFPSGFDLTAASDFSGGSGGDMVFQGPLGNGVTAHWFGEDASGWGVVQSGENAYCNVTVNTLENLLENVIIDYQVLGDVSGNPPHVVSGTIPLRNLGPETPWVSLEVSSGQVPAGQSANLDLTINTTGLEDGMYHAWIILKDNFGTEIIVPVELLVDQFLGDISHKKPADQLEVTLQPNPSRDRSIFNISKPGHELVLIDIFNLQGSVILSEKIYPGGSDNVTYIWDGKDQQGNNIPAGIYVARFISGNNVGFAKIIRIE